MSLRSGIPAYTCIPDVSCGTQGTATLPTIKDWANAMNADVEHLIQKGDVIWTGNMHVDHGMMIPHNGFCIGENTVKTMLETFHEAEIERPYSGYLIQCEVKAFKPEFYGSIVGGYMAIKIEWSGVSQTLCEFSTTTPTPYGMRAIQVGVSKRFRIVGALNPSIIPPMGVGDYLKIKTQVGTVGAFPQGLRADFTDNDWAGILFFSLKLFGSC